MFILDSTEMTTAGPEDESLIHGQSTIILKAIHEVVLKLGTLLY